MTHCRRTNLGLDLADIDKTDSVGIVGDETGFSTTSHMSSHRIRMVTHMWVGSSSVHGPAQGTTKT
jgi:hypothetical protein